MMKPYTNAARILALLALLLLLALAATACTSPTAPTKPTPACTPTTIHHDEVVTSSIVFIGGKPTLIYTTTPAYDEVICK